MNLSFAHNWTTEVLDRPPLVRPVRHFVYPRHVEEVERGALEVMVRPHSVAGPQQAFLATCALGFADPAAPTGVWSCPDPAWLCAVAGGYAYLIDTADPLRWEQVAYRPVLEVRPLVEQGLLLFAGHHSITAWGIHGKAWESARLSSEGVQIVDVKGWRLTGLGWDMTSDRDLEFSLDLHTGAHSCIAVI